MRNVFPGLDAEPVGAHDVIMDSGRPYAVTLAELERSTQVPYDQLVMEQGEPPPPGPLAPEDLARQRLLGISSAGV